MHAYQAGALIVSIAMEEFSFSIFVHLPWKQKPKYQLHLVSGPELVNRFMYLYGSLYMCQANPLVVRYAMREF